ncbi:hypothetical protein [Maridesulfovibrio sp.]|uniref:hypothetical protein n=1 Tax=Maridesulfovibrio sp. TaxID=2795000 RepID=UPI002AA83F13|nr:hypothetical protein [Maridesulfovibrio sp.]
MVSFLLWLRDFVVLFLCRSPICSVTNDSSFDEFSQKKDIRLSLLRLSFGTRILYIITYDQNGFAIYKVLSIDELCAWPRMSEFSQPLSEYQDHLNILSKDKVDVEIDYLKSCLNDAANSKNHFHMKVSIYLVVLSIITPLFVGDLAKMFKNNPKELIQYIVMGGALLACYYFFKTSVFLIKYLRTKSVEKMVFKRLKENPSVHKLAEFYYARKVLLEQQNRCLGSYVRHIEENLLIFFLLAICNYILCQDISLGTMIDFSINFYIN